MCAFLLSHILRPFFSFLEFLFNNLCTKVSSGARQHVQRVRAGGCVHTSAPSSSLSDPICRAWFTTHDGILPSLMPIMFSGRSNHGDIILDCMIYIKAQSFIERNKNIYIHTILGHWFIQNTLHISGSVFNLLSDVIAGDVDTWYLCVVVQSLRLDRVDCWPGARSRQRATGMCRWPTWRPLGIAAWPSAPWSIGSTPSLCKWYSIHACQAAVSND